MKPLFLALLLLAAGSLVFGQSQAGGPGGSDKEAVGAVALPARGLEIRVKGPVTQYVGGKAKYIVTLRNSREAALHGVRCELNLPPNVEYLGGIRRGRRKADGTKVSWVLSNLQGKKEKTYFFYCRFKEAGLTPVAVVATAKEDLSASGDVKTDVRSFAKLTLQADGPVAPVPVGQTAAYKIRIHNVGTKAVEGVTVNGYFSRGIEPTGADGAANRVAPGQVAFASMSIAPGATKILTIRASAEVSGTHVFRAEVRCPANNMRFFAEESSEYFEEFSGDESKTRDSPAEESEKSKSKNERHSNPDDFREKSKGPVW